MADWCYYAVGFNSDSILDAYEEELVQEKAGGERDDYEEGYGYSSPLLHVEQENLELFYPDARDEDDAVENGCTGLIRDIEGEALITSAHPKFKEICGLIRQTVWPDVYIVEGKKRDWKSAMEYLSSNEIKTLSICEIEPPQ